MLPKRAQSYVIAIIILGGLLALGSWIQPGITEPLGRYLLPLSALVLAVAVSRLVIPQGESGHVLVVFLFAGALILPYPLFALLTLLSMLIEWTIDRLRPGHAPRQWFMYPFHGAVYIIAGAAAALVFHFASGDPSSLQTPESVVGALAAVSLFVLIDRFLIAQALQLVQSGSWSTAAWLERDTLLADLTFPVLGYIVALLWSVDPVLFFPSLLLILLVSRSATIPQLKREAQTDAKTGLLNARYWRSTVQNEFERSRRFGRPMALIMADLDLLRTVNNVYGHLAGDVVLRGVSDIIRDAIRDYDILGRFGGEEYALVLPEIGLAEARAIAERLRLDISRHEFAVSTNRTPIRVTMSFGVACFPQDADSLDSLIHTADLALYQAKLNGRNRVATSNDIPYSLELSTLAASGTTQNHLTSGASTEHVPPVALPKDSPPEKPLPAAKTREVDSQTRPSPSPTAAAAASPHQPSRRNPLFWTTIVGIASLLLGVGFAFGMPPDFTAIALFALLAVFTSLVQVEIFGRSGITVAPAYLVGGTLLGGVTGTLIISLFMSVTALVMRPRSMRQGIVNWLGYLILAAPFALLPTMAEQMAAENLILFYVALAIPLGLASGLLATWLTTWYRLSTEDGQTRTNDWRGQNQWQIIYQLALGVIGVLVAAAYVFANMVGLIVFSAPLALIYLAQRQYETHIRNSVLEQRRMNAELTYANREIVAASQAIRQLNDELFITLSKIIDARDPDVHGHAQRVAAFAEAIALDLGLPADQVQRIRQAGLLHDIGKIGISEEILHKPGPLSTGEYEIIKTHTTLGGDLLETSQGLRDLSPLVRHHHERWDGTGYPKRLQGEEIPLGARILAVCDSAEAMATTRPYQHARSYQHILQELRLNAGSQFDPVVVESFTRVAKAMNLLEQAEDASMPAADYFRPTSGEADKTPLDERVPEEARRQQTPRPA